MLGLTHTVARGRSRRLLVALAASASLAAGAAVIAPAAQAAYEVESAAAPMLDAAGNQVTQAGAHPFVLEHELKIGLVDPYTPTGLVREAVVDLPVGFAGDPSEFPTCTDEQFSNSVCPLATQIGTLEIDFGWGSGLSGAVYNLPAPRGKAARFAASVLGLVNAYFEATVRPGDNGVRVSAPDISQAIPIFSTKLRLWGVPADPGHDGERYGPASPDQPLLPFLTTATTCGTPQMTLTRSRAWMEPDGWVETPFQGAALTGCDALDFDPDVRVQPEHTVAGTPAGYTVELAQQLNDDPDGLSTSHLKDATVALPEGVTINPGVATGLSGCSEAQVGLGSGDPASCPTSSKLGEVTVETPLLDQPLTGGVYQAAQNANPFDSTLALYLVPKNDRYGVTMKLAGEIKTDPTTGRLTTVFKDNPQQPWSKMTLKLKGGDRAVLLNPTSCGVKATDWSLTPWARPDSPVSGTDEFTIDTAPAGGSCANDLFAPTFTAGTNSPVAGASSPFSMTFGVGEGQQNLSSVLSELPTGLLGKVGSVPLCPEAQANVGACDVGSRVGDVVASLGGANQPLVVPQAGKTPTSVYMSGPYKGAPFSLSLVVPAQAGPLDLGTVVARAALFVDENDAHVTAKLVESRVIDRSGAVVQTIDGGMPQIVDGVPLPYRSVTINLNREGFMVNPTSCAPKAIKATIGSVTGASVQRDARFQVGECASLRLTPSLGMTFTGGAELKLGKHPGIEANLGTISGDANLKQVKATLPLAVALDPSNAKALCEPDDAAKGTCPEASIIGEASATTPLLSGPVSGPVYFVKGFRTGANGKQIATLPKLLIALSGQGVKINVRADSSVSGPSGKQHLVTTFVNLPDVPLKDFRLRINSGASGVLKATTDVCPAAKGTAVEFIGQNNKVLRRTIQGKAVGCKTKITSASATKSSVSVRVSGIGAGQLTVSGRGVRTAKRTVRGSDAATVSAKLRMNSAQRKRLAGGRSVRVAVRVTFKPKSGQRVTLKRTVAVAGIKRR